MRLKYLAAFLVAVIGLSLSALSAAKGINMDSGILKASAVCAFLATMTVVAAILEPSTTQRERQKH